MVVLKILVGFLALFVSPASSEGNNGKGDANGEYLQTKYLQIQTQPGKKRMKLPNQRSSSLIMGDCRITDSR